MKYIINLSIAFDTDTTVLMLNNDVNLFIKLSKPAARLLCELIANNNTTLIRKDIIKTVWSDYGFTPSTASLSNHISELRKAFENLGLNKDIIITVPRTGFRMEADIHPVISSEDIHPETVTVPLDVLTTDTSFSEVNNPTPIKKGIKTEIFKHKISFKTAILVSGVLISSIAAVFTLFFLKNNKTPQIIFTSQKCKVYNISNKSPDSEFIKNTTDMMNTEGIDCKKNSVDIYYTETRPASKLKINFMAACFYGEKPGYKNCVNYKKIK